MTKETKELSLYSSLDALRSPQAEHCLEMDSNREYVGRWRHEGDGLVSHEIHHLKRELGALATAQNSRGRC